MQEAKSDDTVRDLLDTGMPDPSERPDEATYKKSRRDKIPPA